MPRPTRADFNRWAAKIEPPLTPEQREQLWLTRIARDDAEDDVRQIRDWMHQLSIAENAEK